MKKTYRDYTLGEIEDEIDTMQRGYYSDGLHTFLPKSLYVQAKQALETLKALKGGNEPDK